MKSPFETEFKNLHAAALTLATKMLAELPQGMQDELERGTRQGGKLLMQLGPLPDCRRVELVLREREGATHVIAAMGASHD
jgi:hypothetical protein